MKAFSLILSLSIYSITLWPIASKVTPSEPYQPRPRPAIVQQQKAHAAPIRSPSLSPISSSINNNRKKWSSLFSSKIAHAASLFKPYYASLTPSQRLATTPLYYVGNAQSGAYLSEDKLSGSEGQRVVTYYMSYEDATRYLEEISQSQPSSAHEHRISTISMEKVMEQIITKKQSRKLGKHTMPMIYRIQPSARQTDNARRIIRTSSTATNIEDMSKYGATAIPMFSAPGLVIQRGHNNNNNIITPYYFALEDLQNDWSRMLITMQEKQQQGSVNKPSKQPKVIVHDFADVMCLASGISKQSLYNKDKTMNVLEMLGSDKKEDMVQNSNSNKNSGNKIEGELLSQKQLKKAIETPGIVPPREEIEMLKKYYRHQEGLRGEYSKPRYFRNH